MALGWLYSSSGIHRRVIGTSCDAWFVYPRLKSSCIRAQGFTGGLVELGFRKSPGQQLDSRNLGCLPGRSGHRFKRVCFAISHRIRGRKTAATAQRFMYAGRSREPIGAGLLGWVNGGETWTPERNLTPVITESLAMRNIISPGVD